MADSELVQCYNKGCLQKFKPDENNEKACIYHPGQPVFHDVYKSWSCCKKKTTDFTVFLNTKGCTTGAHNPEKPPEPEKPNDNTNGEEISVVVNAPKPPQCAPRLPSDYPKKRLPVIVAQSLKNYLIKTSSSSTSEMSNGECSETAEIPIGTQCRRPGCSKTYEKNFDENDQCWYHNGTAIFHEGMKYWSCCQRKTSDFDAFLQQQGCSSGRHCFVKEKSENKMVDNCRYDWHQTKDDLYVTIYAKLCQPADSWVDCNEVSLKAHVEYDEGNAIFDLNVPLWGAVQVDNSQVTMTAAKVEVRMKKKEKVSWPKLMWYIKPVAEPRTEEGDKQP